MFVRRRPSPGTSVRGRPPTSTGICRLVRGPAWWSKSRARSTRPQRRTRCRAPPEAEYRAAIQMRWVTRPGGPGTEPSPSTRRRGRRSEAGRRAPGALIRPVDSVAADRIVTISGRRREAAGALVERAREQVGPRLRNLKEPRLPVEWAGAGADVRRCKDLEACAAGVGIGTDSTVTAELRKKLEALLRKAG